MAMVVTSDVPWSGCPWALPMNIVMTRASMSTPHEPSSCSGRCQAYTCCLMSFQSSQLFQSWQ